MSPPDMAHLTPQTLEEAGDGSEPLEHLSPSSISACISNQALLRTAPQVCHNPGWKTQLIATSSPPLQLAGTDPAAGSPAGTSALPRGAGFAEGLPGNGGFPQCSSPTI